MRDSIRRAIYSVVRFFVDRRDRKTTGNTTFPTAQGHNYLNEPMFANSDGVGFFTKFYAEDAENPLALDFKRFKTEILVGELKKRGLWHEVKLETPSALPYSITHADYFNVRGEHSIEIKQGERVSTFRNLVSERFYYLPIREPGSVMLRSDFDLIVGKPIPLIQKKPHRNKLTLVLFVDNFAREILDMIDFERDLPNMARFFAKGLKFDNCFSSSNWTLPSVASMMSGRSPHEHGLVHPRKDVVVGSGYPLMSEIFQRDDYLTFQACGNWRKSPRYGYAKGYDRTVYRNQLSASDAFDALYAQLRAFPERDCFAWLSLFDLHHPVALVPDIDVQLNVPLSAHDFFTEDTKTPLQLGQSDARTDRYVADLKRLDFHLGQFFGWLESRYEDDQFLVAMIADHGTTFLTDDKRLLARERCRVTFMVRGGGVPQGCTFEFVQNSDLMPLLAKLAGIEYLGDGEGRVPECLGGPAARSLACTEILYPGEPYSASLWGQEFNFHLETAAQVDDAGKPDFRDYSVALFRNGAPHMNVAANFPEQISIFEHALFARFNPSS